MAYSTSNTTNVAFTDTSASSPLSKKAKEVVLTATEDCYISFDSTTVTATNGFYITADKQYIFHILYPPFITVIKVTSDGVLSVMELGDSVLGLGITYIDTFTGDANLLRENVIVTFTGDADLIKVDISTDFTSDSNLQIEVEASISGDANIDITMSDTFSGDSHLAETISDTFSGDCLLITATRILGTFTGDANLLSVEAATFTGDANLTDTVSALAFNGDAKLVTI